MNRWKNYGLWVSIGSLILLVMQQFNASIDVGKYNDVVNLVLSILVAAGIISNPQSGKGYLDE
jgi:uncharacterized membrane protein